MRRDDDKARDANSGICPEATRERTSMRRFPVETPERRHLRCSKRHPNQAAAEPRGDFCRVVQMTCRSEQKKRMTSQCRPRQRCYWYNRWGALTGGVRSFHPWRQQARNSSEPEQPERVRHNGIDAGRTLSSASRWAGVGIAFDGNWMSDHPSEKPKNRCTIGGSWNGTSSDRVAYAEAGEEASNQIRQTGRRRPFSEVFPRSREMLLETEMGCPEPLRQMEDSGCRRERATR